MRISDWSSDVCSSDLAGGRSRSGPGRRRCPGRGRRRDRRPGPCGRRADRVGEAGGTRRSPDGRRRGGAIGGVAADRQGGGRRTHSDGGRCRHAGAPLMDQAEPSMFGTAEFWVLVALVIFVALVARKIAATVGAMLDQRAVPIRNQIEEADGKREEAQTRLTEIRKRQRDAASEAEEMVRSEEHTSELQSLMRISYAVLCLKKKKSTQ